MRTHTSLEVIEIILATNRHNNGDSVVVSNGFLMRLESELKQLEEIALQVVKVSSGNKFINVEQEKKKLQEMAEKWDGYE